MLSKEPTRTHFRTLGWKCFLNRNSSGNAAANAGIKPRGNSGTDSEHPSAQLSPVLVLEVVISDGRALLEAAVVEVLEVDVISGVS